MGNFCSFGPPNEPSPPPVRRVKPGGGEEEEKEKSGSGGVSPSQHKEKRVTQDSTKHKKSEKQDEKLSVVTTIPTIVVNNNVSISQTTATTTSVASSSPKSTTRSSSPSSSASSVIPASAPQTTTEKSQKTKKEDTPVSAKIESKASQETSSTAPTATTPAATPTPTPTPTPAAPSTEVKPPSSKTLKTCAKCNKTITGTMVEAMNKEYHEACFVCGNCKGELAGRFAVIDGSPYCPTCAVAATKNRKGSLIRPNISVSGGGSRIESPSSRSGSKIESAGGSGSRIESPSSRSGSRIEGSSGGSKIQSGQMGLLQWCKNRTQDYPGVEIKDFVKSWKDGLAFCALLHSYRPDLIDFNSLSAENKEKNIALAFEAAEKMEIPQLLDPEDFALEKLSMMTYLSSMYEKLGKVKVEE